MLNFKGLRAEVRKRLIDREWTYANLAKATGYSYRTIEFFMGKSEKDREPGVHVAAAIAKAPYIPEYMAR